MSKGRVLVALDVPDLDQAGALVDQLHDKAAGFKIGLELITAVGGAAAIQCITKRGGRVFYDGKFMDIPNTVKGATRQAALHGAWMINLHCLAGAEAIRQARQVLEEVSAESERPLLIGVTLLTSLGINDLLKLGLTRDEDLFFPSESPEQVKLLTQKHIARKVAGLAAMGQKHGLDGVIASPREASAIRENCGPDFLIVTPGVRLAGNAVGDQKRVLTPREAIEAGANYLVIGRPITSPESGTPLDALRRINDEVEAALVST